jgi:hypothetical protein
MSVTASAAYPDPGSVVFLTGMGKKTLDPDSESGSGMNNPDHIS